MENILIGVLLTQESHLGSLLCLVYVNEMYSFIEHGKLLQFANITAINLLFYQMFKKNV